MTFRDPDSHKYGKRREGGKYSYRYGYDQFGNPKCKHGYTAEWCDICNYQAKEYKKKRDKYIGSRIKAIDKKVAEYNQLKARFPQLEGIKQIPKLVVPERKKRTFGRQVA